MQRFHVHLGVPDLAASIRFYSDLFGMPPAVAKPDYAKWMLDDPRVNFAISHRSARVGLNHLGLQADSTDELAGIRTRFEAADATSLHDETNITCCYARGDKHWVRDPQGVAWEAFHTLEAIPLFDGTPSINEATDDRATAVSATGASCGTDASGCCAPAEAVADKSVSHAARSGCCQ